MQREKLYNLQSKAYFNCVVFVFKKRKILCEQFLSLQKKSFFLHERGTLFLILSFITQYALVKKQNIPIDAA